MILVNRRLIIVGIRGDAVLHFKKVVGIAVNVRFRRGRQPHHQGVEILKDRPVLFENAPVALVDND